ARGRRGQGPGRGTIVRSRKNDLVREGEIRMIENVEGFRPELQIQSLGDPDFLEEGSIDIHQTGTTKHAPRHVPESPLNRKLEGFWIEPIVHTPQDYRALKVRIPIRGVGLIGIARPGDIGAGQGCERESA